MEIISPIAWDIGFEAAEFSNRKFDECARLKAELAKLEACDLDVLPDFVADIARCTIAKFRQRQIESTRAFISSMDYAAYWLDQGIGSVPNQDDV